MPLLKDNNNFIFSHPLGGVQKVKNGYELYIGHKKISTLQQDIFPMQCKIESMSVKLDGKSVESKFGETLEFSKNFLVESKKGARVNVIGYSKKGVRSEDNLLLSAADIDKNYSLDSKGKIFRVEVYEGKNFCGMLNLKAK